MHCHAVLSLRSYIVWLCLLAVVSVFGPSSLVLTCSFVLGLMSLHPSLLLLVVTYCFFFDVSTEGSSSRRPFGRHVEKCCSAINSQLSYILITYCCEHHGVLEV